MDSIVSFPWVCTPVGLGQSVGARKGTQLVGWGAKRSVSYRRRGSLASADRGAAGKGRAAGAALPLGDQSALRSGRSLGVHQLEDDRHLHVDGKLPLAD